MSLFYLTLVASAIAAFVAFLWIVERLYIGPDGLTHVVLAMETSRDYGKTVSAAILSDRSRYELLRGSALDGLANA